MKYHISENKSGSRKLLNETGANMVIKHRAVTEQRDMIIKSRLYLKNFFNNRI
ncbi:MAG: hypothetical protein OZ913_06995 [Ignavibacteriaceae bacterium]|nr:hypothetical protein [Ignavibacteria bacterium]MCC6885877.1 hypothetical protein [Ignavibacteriales bacterium]MEB2330036.1 hypothetical protein [Ignavibacteriaceae bacterium]